jgi:Skp family chaperone for outer membrane proteins
MKHILFAVFLVSSLFAAEPKIATINYDTVYTKWATSADFTAQTKASLEAVNVKLSIKSNTRETILKQAQELGSTKPKDIAESKQIQSRLQLLQAELEAVHKELQSLQESPELRKQIQERQAELRDQIKSAVTAQAKAAKADFVVDTSTVNIYGLPLVTTMTETNDITEAVVTALNAASISQAAPAKK